MKIIGIENVLEEHKLKMLEYLKKTPTKKIRITRFDNSNSYLIEFGFGGEIVYPVFKSFSRFSLECTCSAKDMTFGRCCRLLKSPPQNSARNRR